jgi:hypothetical protein
MQTGVCAENSQGLDSGRGRCWSAIELELRFNWPHLRRMVRSACLVQRQGEPHTGLSLRWETGVKVADLIDHVASEAGIEKSGQEGRRRGVRRDPSPAWPD